MRCQRTRASVQREFSTPFQFHNTSFRESRRWDHTIPRHASTTRKGPPLVVVERRYIGSVCLSRPGASVRPAVERHERVARPHRRDCASLRDDQQPTTVALAEGELGRERARGDPHDVPRDLVKSPRKRICEFSAKSQSISRARHRSLKSHESTYIEC